MTETIAAPPGPVGANYSGGEWRPSRSGRTYEKRNPARPSDVVGTFPASGEDDVAAAVEAASAAFAEWGSRPAAQRAAVLAKAADAIDARVEDIAQDMTREMGKPLREARMESARAAAIFRFFAGEAYRPTGEQ
jgi:aldehyde dehydrogenase (NAD+)